MNNIFVSFDKFADYVPVVSTLTNLVDLFKKCVIIPCMKQETVKNSDYYTHLSQKHAVRCIVLLIPIAGNLVIGIFDLVKKNKACTPQINPPVVKNASSIITQKSSSKISPIKKLLNEGPCEKQLSDLIRSQLTDQEQLNINMAINSLPSRQTQWFKFQRVTDAGQNKFVTIKVTTNEFAKPSVKGHFTEELPNEYIQWVLKTQLS